MTLARKLGLSFTIGSRLLRSGQGFVSLLGVLVFLSLALGVTVLIVVSSVMNGMASEIERNLLGELPHVELLATADTETDWAELYRELQAQPGVVLRQARRYESGYALLNAGGNQLAVELRAVRALAGASMAPRYLDGLPGGAWHAVVDEQLAFALGLDIGASVRLSLGGRNSSPLGGLPRRRYFTLSDFAQNTGGAALPIVRIALEDGRKFMRREQARERGLALWLNDRNDVDAFVASFHDLWRHCCRAQTWKAEHSELFAALRLEKWVVSVLLFCVLLVAVFNLVSMFSLLMRRKRHSIVMLLSIGATRAQIYRSFMAMGVLLGLCGVLVGVLSGLGLSASIGDIMDWWQEMSGSYLLSSTGFYISTLPAEIWWGEVLLIAVLALAACVPAIWWPLSTLLDMSPAETLRHV